MRIVYVSALWGGGPISHLRYLLPHIVAAGADVKVLCTLEHVAGLFRAAGIDAEVAPLNSKRDVPGAWALRHHFRTADIVHTHDRRAGLLARPVARAVGARVVHTYHGLPEPIAVKVGRRGATAPGVSRLRGAWLLHGYLGIEGLLARLGAVVVPSHAMSRFLRKHGVPANRTRVIPSGVDIVRTDPEPAHEPFVIGTVAILHHLKGVDILVDACARIPRRVVLRVVGDGPSRDDLERRARGLGIPVEFVGAVDDVRDHVAGFDLFVLPSRGENLPISILEAMSLAVPVVATDVGGVRELLEDGSGVLVEPDSPGTLADAVTALIDDPERRTQIARAGSLRARNEFSAHDVARRLLTLYEEFGAAGG